MTYYYNIIWQICSHWPVIDRVWLTKCSQCCPAGIIR